VSRTTCTSPKALYTFDAAHDPEWDRYRQCVVDDIAKASRVAVDGTDIFASSW
jgi:hypothetical protein